MVLSQEHDDNFRQKEMQQWDEQAPRYEEKRITDPIYMAGIDAVVNNIGPDPKAFILDAACGTGLTIKKYYRPGMRIVALDLSLESLKTLRRTFPCESIYLVKGGLTCLPFPSDTFNRVICANAITQVPKSDLREKCFYELARVGRLHAKIVVSGHNYSQPKKRAGWPKEGIARSSSGNVQYIYRFDRDEFRFLLGKTSQIQCIRGAGLPLLYKWKLSWLSRRLERLLRLFSFSTSWGNMIVGTGLKI